MLHHLIGKDIVGNNTFKVYRQAASGFVSPNATKCRTWSAANQFCIDQGKSLKILLFKEHHPPYILGNFPRAEIHFTCLDANDPELKTGEFVDTQQFTQCVETGQNDSPILEGWSNQNIDPPLTSFDPSTALRVIFLFNHVSSYCVFLRINLKSVIS